MFWTTAEDNGEGLDPVKHVYAPPTHHPSNSFQGGSSQLCLCIYVWYASIVATCIADRFASFYILRN